ncbi:MAG: ABC transporter substrate-binding protein [Butyrivibrio sp.]|nr:ABC transporter substrate-binding protein [Butyrivibrio sp.]
MIRRTFLVDIAFEGGSGKAYIKSPVEVTDIDGSLSARFVWSSENYDYMIVDGIRYDNENEGGESTFTVPVESVSGTLRVVGDTVAMSAPHEIEYLITWGETSETGSETPAVAHADKEAVTSALKNAGLSGTGSTELKYADCFEIEKYGDYTFVSIDNSGDYLIVPEGGDVPQGLPENVVVLKKPLNRTYLVSTSAMDLVNACGALDMITLSGTKAGDWYIDAAKEAMEKGDILYAGKYRAPDYELILKSGCNLAVENTMIYHEPAVREKLTELGVPVLVETSSLEMHPLGRLEWIKLYGALFDREEEAADYFNEQLKMMEPIIDRHQNTGKTVAFFHVTGNGLINVRKSGDYITKMIELAGGNYVLTGAGKGQNALSTMNMQMEEFYAEAVGADIIIYNSTIGGEIASIDELVKKNALFADFKAVKDGKVYCTEQSLFQQITGMAQFMQNLNDVFNDVDREYTYLNRLD